MFWNLEICLKLLLIYVFYVNLEKSEVWEPTVLKSEIIQQELTTTLNIELDYFLIIINALQVNL